MTFYFIQKCLGFDPSFGNLACLVILKSSDRIHSIRIVYQVCLWMTEHSGEGIVGRP